MTVASELDMEKTHLARADLVECDCASVIVPSPGLLVAKNRDESFAHVDQGGGRCTIGKSDLSGR